MNTIKKRNFFRTWLLSFLWIVGAIVFIITLTVLINCSTIHLNTAYLTLILGLGFGGTGIQLAIGYTKINDWSFPLDFGIPIKPAYCAGILLTLLISIFSISHSIVNLL